MSFSYPNSVFDRREALLALLGSHWSNYYGGADLVGDIVFARAQLERQTFNNLIETVQALNRRTTPVFHTENWTQLELLASQRNSTPTALLHYGDGAVFGPQPSGELYEFGVPFGSIDSAFPIPADWQDAPLLFSAVDRRSNPVCWVKNVDYRLDLANQLIVFRDNPFNDPRLRPETIFSAGAASDSSLTLWAYKTQRETNQLYQHFGYLLGLQLPSSPGYRDLLNGLLDSLTGGTTRATLEACLSALTGVPLTRGASETVQVVTSDAQGALIITDQQVYRFAATATPLVKVGQTVTAGQPLVDALLIDEFQGGEIPSGLQSLSVGEGFLAAGYFGDLVFQNITTPLLVTADSAGYTKVSFQVGGFPSDVAQFWNQVHANGVAKGQTLANLLDQRPQPRSGQPGPGALPATVNPLQFLVSNLLRNNAFLVRIKATDLGAAAVGLARSSLLRRIIPPGTAMIVLAELAVGEESVIMSGAASASSPGYSESPGINLGLSEGTETVAPTTYIAELTPLLQQLGAACT